MPCDPNAPTSRALWVECAANYHFSPGTGETVVLRCAICCTPPVSSAACGVVLAMKEIEPHVLCWLVLCGLVVAGWRIIGKATNCSATLFIRIHCGTNTNSVSRNWVRLRPPSCLLLSCIICFDMLVVLPVCGVRAIEVYALIPGVQASWYGATTVEPMLPPTMHSALLAWSFCLLSKCTEGGSWKRTAAICGHSCFASTRRLTWRPTIWDARCC
jgi:hypothetical protein